MSERINWVFLILPLLLLLGCEAGGLSFPQVTPASPTLTSPTPADTLITPTPIETVSSTPTLETATTISIASLYLTLPDCASGFWDPSERESQIMHALDHPGIVTVQTLDVTLVRLIYDPTQLNQGEAIWIFESSSGLKVIETDP